VLVNPDSMLTYGVNLHEIEAALQRSNSNLTSGHLDGQGPNEFLVRSLGRVQSVEDLRKLVVKIRSGRPVLLTQVANVIEGPEIKRGDSSAFVGQEDGKFAGGPCVILRVNKQPGTDTRQLTEHVTDALEELKTSLPADIRMAPEGGLAVAIGELVDDAIVDVENIFRRLRENRRSADPKPALLVVFQASAEIRNSIVFSTLIIVLVFIPLFALSGMEGRLFTPLGGRLYRLDPGVVGGLLDRNAGAVLLAPAPIPRYPP